MYDKYAPPPIVILLFCLAFSWPFILCCLLYTIPSWIYMVDACAHMIVYISIMARYTAKEDDPYDPTLSYVCGSVIGLMSMALRRFAIAHFLDVISMMQLGVVAALLCRKQIELPTIPAKPTNGSCTSRH